MQVNLAQIIIYLTMTPQFYCSLWLLFIHLNRKLIQILSNKSVLTNQNKNNMPNLRAPILLTNEI